MNVLDRKTAADMLQVSIRTIDRYIHNGNLQKEVINGRIFIRSKGLRDLLEQKKIQEQYLSDIYSTPEKPSHGHQKISTSPKSHELAKDTNPAPAGPTTETPSEPIEAHYTEGVTSHPSSADQDGEIYRKLYEEAQDALKDQQKRLEGANYRVGQLEGLLKETVPLLEYRKALALENQKREELEDILNTFEKDNERLNQTIEAKQQELQHLGGRLGTERFNKKVFIIMLIILFALQPLWLILPLQ